MITLLMSGLTSISTNSPGLAPDPTDDRHESTYSEWEDAFVVSKDGGITMSSSGGDGVVGPTVTDPKEDSKSTDSAGLSIVKLTNGEDVSSPHDLEIPAGDSVTWSYNVTNIGDVALTEIVVNDDVEGYVGTIASLGIGESNNSLSLSNTSVVGIYQNNVTASTTHNDVEVNASDYSYYFGVSETSDSAGLSIVKLTNGEDVSSPHDLEIPAGDSVTWSYNVTNMGDVALTEIVVNDDVEGYVGTIASLGVGESNNSLSLSNISVVGVYQNNVTASTTHNDVEVNASDYSYYFGVSETSDSAGLSIVKLTNGEDVSSPHDLEIPAGDSVTWSYNVTNMGDVALTEIVVNDDVEGYVGTIASLGVGESNNSLSLSNISVVGVYQNNVTASTTHNDVEVNASDYSYYFGVNASIDIEKFTDGHDADEPIGPFLLLGYPVEWTYEVKNTGNVNLVIDVQDNDVNVTPLYMDGDDGDDVFEPGEVWVYNASGTVILGQHSNFGNVTGYNGTFIATDADSSHYFGINNPTFKDMAGGKGYWKNPDNWPEEVTEITIGNVTYLKDDAINYQNPVEDKPYILFGQLVPAKLNVMVGLPYYPYVIDGELVYFIEAADAWLEEYPLGSTGPEVDAAWAESGEELKDVLEMYNNGVLYSNG
ncbi:hypothetical protein [Methanococcoides methylutens]|nr:hypothetical protein [Methanococcoides methylutens]